MSADIENKAIIKQLYEEVWNKRRLELVDEIISPSHALHDPNATGSAVGPEAYKRLVTRFITAFPDLRFNIEDFFGENEDRKSTRLKSSHRCILYAFFCLIKKYISYDDI